MTAYAITLCMWKHAPLSSRQRASSPEIAQPPSSSSPRWLYSITGICRVGAWRGVVWRGAGVRVRVAAGWGGVGSDGVGRSVRRRSEARERRAKHARAPARRGRRRRCRTGG